jgi:hypothetical protein
MSDQFQKTRCRAERLASASDRILGFLEEALTEETEAVDATLKLATSYGHIHAALCEERSYLNDMVDEAILDEDALDLDNTEE